MKRAMTGILAVAGAAVAAQGAGTLYAVNSAFDEPGQVWTVDQSTGLATSVVTIGGGGFVSLTGAEFLNGSLYVSDNFHSSGLWLGKVDLSTGAYTGVSTQGGDANIHGLAGNAAKNVLYAIGQSTGTLWEIDPVSGGMTSIGSPGIDGRGMAYDNTTGTLYATSSDGGLYTLDTSTAQATLIGRTGLGHDGIGLAYDEVDGTLYATQGAFFSGSDFNLYRLDTGTAAATLVGSTGVTNLDGLAWQIPSPGAAVFGAAGVLIAARRKR